MFSLKHLCIEIRDIVDRLNNRVLIAKRTSQVWASHDGYFSIRDGLPDRLTYRL